MKIILLVIGKTHASYLKEGLAEYQKRLRHYISFEMQVIPDLKKKKNLSEEQQKHAEGLLIVQQLKAGDHVVLLDEKGKSYSSRKFARFLQERMNAGSKRLIFVVGGPYGFSEDVYTLAKGKISLSEMTFSHEMIRLFFTEQVYRAFTILRGEPYHHD